MTNFRPRILVVDDDPAILSQVASAGASEDCDVVTATTTSDAVQQLRQHSTGLVLLDLRLPGATDRVRQLLRGVGQDSSESAPVERFCGMVGSSDAIREVFDLIRRLAPHARTTLITGETGTGKELAARALHTLGPRSHRRLVTVNCSAIVDTLFESELFGHVRGAFTGAIEHKAGLFEMADGGTLFLDEVGELPAGAQAKLLRVLEDGEVQRVGALEPRRVDVRVIAATNRDLHAEVAAGRFRSDLYYRLNVVEIHLPTLRERSGDVVALAEAFVGGFGETLGKPLRGLTPAAENVLRAADWEGNVRQLRNAVERACILADGDRVTELDLAGGMGRTTAESTSTHKLAAVVPMPDPSTRLSAVEREHIVRVLAHVGGNKAVAARLLGISRRAFYRQLERHGLHHRAATVSTVAGPHAGLERAS